MGVGTVGSGVAQVLAEKAGEIARTVGRPIRVRRALVREPEKARGYALAPAILTTNVADILEDGEIDVVVELLGGEDPAYRYIQQALRAGKHVVTANKEVLAKFGPELHQLAKEHGADLYFEASVGGGIPLISPFKQVLVANRITRLRAIINGTTNYILTKMADEGTSFAAALRQAQELGYAENDPRNDVEGIDAAYKLAILASLAFHTVVRPHQVYHEGISRLHPHDFRYARELGYAIKLLAIAKQEGSAVEARVHPVLIPGHVLLAQVNGVFNAVEVEGDLSGRVMFYGRGAGAEPTAGAVVADIIDLAHNLRVGVTNRIAVRYDEEREVKPMADIVSRYYLRMEVADNSGVLAQIASVLGVNDISISSVMQKESDETAQTAEIVIMTHIAKEAAVQAALYHLEHLPAVRELSNFIRVEN
jgi:homoserine dehydrogenase